MLDIQVSYIRILVGDNRQPYTYTDNQIRAAAVIGPLRPALPIDLRMCGLLGFRRYPRQNAMSLSALTDAQLATLTDAQLAALVD